MEMTTYLEMTTYFSPLIKLPLWNEIDKCADNCSGHGQCYQGVCFCEVQFSGGSCTDPNLSYFIAFSSIFYIIGAVSLVQLLVCIKSEFCRMKTPSVVKACRVTTQKALYVLISIATAIRGFYFSSPNNSAVQWTSSLLSAYYPLLLTGSSLIVCFWAEIFHLRDLRLDKPRFLNKSFLGFLAFNIITYSLLLAELVLLQLDTHNECEKIFFTRIFNGLFAFLIVVVVVFFLIYGVQMYFKMHGGFAEGSLASPDTSQLSQSRFGLISQALLLLVTVVFIISDELGTFWKDKIPVLSRNFYDVMFRVVEMGVALWFPCVLWNCVRPEELWILNPQNILKKLESETEVSKVMSYTHIFPLREDNEKTDSSVGTEKAVECWICYDSERQDAGPLIQPCQCRGDVASVHHDCLKKWLIESSENVDNMRCKVCNDQYNLEQGTVWLPQGLTSRQWLQTITIGTLMGGCVGGACIVVRTFDNVPVHTASVGGALLIVLVCFRFLGFHIVTAYQRAKFTSVNILAKKLVEIDQNDTVAFHGQECEGPVSVGSSTLVP
ncbi:uncharacterized protein LOC143245293 isoform X1 [Tachypleus tridentatus]|uniref:uncharacterized protein LOC143245293 isoform X1 n=1 Tax=Tachypleus tridentatus TaxID=6853 RepID=UPI003FD239A9